MSRPPTPTNTFIIGYLAILAVATIAAYSNIFSHSEILRWDDNIYLNSELVKSLAFDNLVSIFSRQHHSNWHPLTTLSFAIEHALWGINAHYSKLVNLFLHIANVLVFYVLCYHLLLLATEKKSPADPAGFMGRLLEDRKMFAIVSSLLAATVFALHPQHVESVAWVSERKGLLCAFFYLSALITYIKSVKEQNPRFTNLTLILMSCALMSKPVAISMPVAFVLLDIYPLRKIERFDFSLATLKTLLTGKLFYILLALASVIITFLYQDPQSSGVLSYSSRLINASTAYLHYLTSIFYPENLAPFYPFQEFSLKPSIDSIIPCLLFSGLVLIVLTLYIKGIHYPLVIFSFYVISLIPMIGLVKVGHQAMADRYAYISTIWFYLLIGVAIFAIFVMLKKTRFQLSVPIAFLSICIFLGYTTYEHSRHWRDDFQLWGRVIDIFPDSASIAYVNLASAHDAKGTMSVTQMQALLDKALLIAPNEPYNLGAAANFYGQLGDEQRSLDYLLRIISIAPYNTWAQTQVGDIYFHRKDVASAGNYYLAALQQGDDSEELIYKLALIDFHFKRYTDALAKLELLTTTRLDERQQKLYKMINDSLAESS